MNRILIHEFLISQDPCDMHQLNALLTQLFNIGVIIAEEYPNYSKIYEILLIDRYPKNVETIYINIVYFFHKIYYALAAVVY
jgi:hypothetical protein